MYTPDVIALRQFYALPIGEALRSLVMDAIVDLWPDAAGDVILGIGYATPYLSPYLNGNQVVCVMPANQGAAYWPPEMSNVVFMSHESELPLCDNVVNRVLVVHAAEHSEQLDWMLREIWRVLTPGGRVLMVVPNRMGLWSRSSISPFGYGRPFSLAQMRDALTDHQFTLTRSSSGVFVPPLQSRLLWRVSRRIERMGKFCTRSFGGVLLQEAEKQIYAGIKTPVIAHRGYRVPVRAKPAMTLEREIG